MPKPRWMTQLLALVAICIVSHAAAAQKKKNGGTGAALSLSPPTITAGQTVTAKVTFADACTGGSISWGDGSRDQPLAQVGAGAAVTMSHRYGTAGAFVVQTYFNDVAAYPAGTPLNAKYGASCKGGPVTMNVAAPAPSVAGGGAPSIIVLPGQPTVGQVANFQFKGTAACQRGLISWGDTPTYGQMQNVPGQGMVAQHTYMAQGTFKVTTSSPAGATGPSCNGSTFVTVIGTGTTASRTTTLCNDGTVMNGTGPNVCQQHGGNKVPTTPPAPTSPNASTTGTRCNDGTTTNETGSHACAKHGGVAAAASAANTPPAPPAPANTNTTGTATLCNDGTSTNESGKHACAKHGGVKQAAAPPAPPSPHA